MRDPVMRLRCPKDTDPAREGDHLAVDVRLPLSLGTTAVILRVLPSCPCGEALVLAGGSDER